MYHIKNSLYAKLPEGMNLKMVDDTNRLNRAVNPALKNACFDKVIIDLGCGTGILGLYALENGAKFVYFVEQDPYMVDILKNSLHKIVDSSKFKIIHNYAQNLIESDFDLGMPDVCVSELWGILLFDEGYYHCTHRLKKIFNDLIFIPEIFHLDVFECDTNFGNLPWPQNEVQLVEHYKYVYSTHGWSAFAVGSNKTIEFLNPKKIGEISYNANTGMFNNHLSAVIHPIGGKMINLSGKMISGGIEQPGTKFGWYVYPSNKKVLIDIFIHKDNEDANVYFSITKKYKNK